MVGEPNNKLDLVLAIIEPSIFFLISVVDVGNLMIPLLGPVEIQIPFSDVPLYAMYVFVPTPLIILIVGSETFLPSNNHLLLFK